MAIFYSNAFTLSAQGIWTRSAVRLIETGIQEYMLWLSGKLLDDAFWSFQTKLRVSCTAAPHTRSRSTQAGNKTAFHSTASHMKLSGYPRQSRHILCYYKRTCLKFALHLLHSAISLILLYVLLCNRLHSEPGQSRSFEFITSIFLSCSIKVISPADQLWSVLR